MPGAKKKKFVVTKVQIRVEASASKYLKEGRASKDLKELLKGVKDLKSWVVESKGEDEVASAHPDVPGHPGHVDGKDWKMYIERGKGTKDRLLLTKRKYSVEPSKRDPNILHVEISACAFVDEDTH